MQADGGNGNMVDSCTTASQENNILLRPICVCSTYLYLLYYFYLSYRIALFLCFGKVRSVWPLLQDIASLLCGALLRNNIISKHLL